MSNPNEINSCKLFIGGLPLDMDDEGLKEYFQQFGHVKDCCLMKDRESSKSRGFAFLTMRDNYSAQIIINKRYHSLGGKQIDCKRALPKDQTEALNALNPEAANAALNEGSLTAAYPKLASSSQVLTIGSD